MLNSIAIPLWIIYVWAETDKYRNVLHITNVLRMQRCQNADGAKGVLNRAKYSNTYIISENINL